MILSPLILESDRVKLIPMKEKHSKGLLKAASDGELWKLWFTSVPSSENVDEYISEALEQQNQGRSLPFVVIDKTTDQIIGSSRYCNIDRKNRRLEIGYTWYAKSFQRTHVNSECKLLLLNHAFEDLKTIAVEFRTHHNNQASRKAIARLGAKQDGVLRSHQILADGSLRDTVVFSIIKGEWPEVKKVLQEKIRR